MRTAPTMLPTFLGVIAAFLLGAALAVVLHPRPLFHQIVSFVTGGSAYQRCVKAGACDALKTGPHDVPAPVPRLRPQEAPPDMDRA